MRKFSSYKLEAIQQKVLRIVLSLMYATTVFLTAYIFEPKTNAGRFNILLIFTPLYAAVAILMSKLISMYWDHVRLKDRYYDEDSE